MFALLLPLRMLAKVGRVLSEGVSYSVCHLCPIPCFSGGVVGAVVALLAAAVGIALWRKRQKPQVHRLSVE